MGGLKGSHKPKLSVAQQNSPLKWILCQEIPPIYRDAVLDIDRSKGGGGGKQQGENLLKIDDYIMKYLKGT